MPVRLYWPQAASLATCVPLVAFSHGIGGSRRGYSYLGQHWAANGLASLHLQHVGSDHVAVFEATGSARKALAIFDGGSHSMFTDRAGTGGVELNPQVKAATQTLSLAFLRHVFGQGDAGALALWAERHRPILARFVGMQRASS